MFSRAFFIGVTLLVLPGGIAYGAIVPQCPLAGCRLCDVVTLANNIISFAIQMSIIIAVLSIVIVGFKSVVSGESGAHELQHTVTNIVIGIVIMLSGWLIVDTILKVLVGGRIGPWHSVECLNTPVAQRADVITSPGVIAVETGAVSGVAGSQCPPGNTACSVSALQAFGFTPAQANVMSCIAMTESAGDPNARNRAPGSTACGTFQVVQSSWRGSGSCSSHSACTDASCNAQAALALMQGRSGRGSIYGDWSCPGCNTKAQACVDKYDPGR